MMNPAWSALSSVVLALYGAALVVLMLYGLHRYWIVYLYYRYRQPRQAISPRSVLDQNNLPRVTIQLPLYNEKYVADRLIESVCAADYPKDRFEVQVLDDSTDETVHIVADKILDMRRRGFDVHHIRRDVRTGYKAGALAHGLTTATGEFVAIFDADFMPPAGFLRATLPHFQDEQVGMVQTRWGHINADYSVLTRVQALFLDGHFLLEHTARYGSGAFFNFNGTAGIWRKKTIESAGGWSARTLTEDLDLSYRAQLKGWRFVYDPDFVCPAELPVDIQAFQSQQRRWTKGALQVARYLLRDLWVAKLPFHTKIEATVHLTGNVGYLLTVLVTLLLLPSLILRGALGVDLGMLELIVFGATVISISSFYAVSQRELYPDWRWRMRDLPALLSFGVGMCVSNARAVAEGLSGHKSEFIRTPKYAITMGGDNWTKKTYAGRRRFGMIEAGFAVYSLITVGVAAATGQWATLPFIFLFVAGFCYVVGLSLQHDSRRA